MQAGQIAARLQSFKGRGAGTDAERRAAGWLAGELARGGRQVALETFWCRPNWALAQAWHTALALAGSLVAVSSPKVGAGLLLAALLMVIADATSGRSPGRWLTRERASQNVVALPRSARRRDGGATGDAAPERFRLILTANYDAGRAGIVYRAAVRRPWARARRLLGGLPPGWLGWLVVAIVWLEAVAILRAEGHTGTAISAVQLLPTVGVVLALAALLELATADWSPAAGDNGSGVGVALALTRALDTASYRHLDVAVVLTGAGAAGGIGLRRYVRAHRVDRVRSNTAVLGVAPCAGGGLRWWRSDGQLIPLRYATRLRRLAASVAANEAYLDAREHDGRAETPAFPARLARIPALGIGCVDRDGLAPRSHQLGDDAGSLDEAAAAAAVQFGLVLVDAIDAALGEPAPAPAPRPA